MGRNKDSLIALAEKLTGETCGEVLTKKDALKKIACFYAGEEVECNTVADALQCIAEHCEGGASGGASGGGSGSSSPITTLKAYAFSVAEQIVYAYSTEEIAEKGTYILIYNDLTTGNRVVTEVTEDTFADENGNVFTRSKTHDVLIDAENELVEVELISGYNFNITSYNFKTQTDNNGIIQENQRFNYLSSYYDNTTECDLCVYGGSGKIGYYKIKQ